MKKLLWIVIALISLHEPTRAQISSYGRDFYGVFLHPGVTCKSQSGYIIVSSPTGALVEFSYIGEYGEERSAPLRVPAMQNRMFLLPLATLDSEERPACSAFHIRASAPVSAQIHFTSAYDAMTLLLPTTALGKHYVIASLPSNPGLGGVYSTFCPVDSTRSDFVVVATVDSTHVTIVPNGTTLKGIAGVSSGLGADGTPRPIRVTLSRGQSYSVAAIQWDHSDDESGSTVDADRPVAVFAGHEGAFTGMSTNISVDQRNMLYQQMVPVEYHVASDYVSIPFVGPASTSSDLTNGDFYRAVTSDSTSSNVRLSTPGSDMTLPITRYGIAEFDNITSAVSFSTTTGTPFMVEQYDYRQYLSSPPFTAPTMMNVVPLSNFVTSAIFSIPHYDTGGHPAQYLNVIAKSNAYSHFKLWIDAVGPQPITKLPLVATYTIPGHPELLGRQYRVAPASYMVTCDSTFEIYSYGFSNEGEYASPTAETFHSTMSPIQTRIASARNCSTLSLHATSTGTAPIVTVDLLEDPSGWFKKRNGIDSGFVSYNVAMPATDHSWIGYTVRPGDTAADVALDVIDSTKPAEAFIWVVNQSGADTVVRLSYNPPTIAPSSIAVRFQNPAAIDSCAEVLIRNSGTGLDPALPIDTAYLTTPSNVFSLRRLGTNVHLLAPGDSAVFLACFAPLYGDTTYVDSVRIHAACTWYTIPLSGHIASPVFSAMNMEYGTLRLGDSQVRAIRIYNAGDADLKIYDAKLEDSSVFRFVDRDSLPLTIAPGKEGFLSFEFVPRRLDRDSTLIHWTTNQPLSPAVPVTKIAGEASVSKLQWNAPIVYFASDGDTIRRLNLKNVGTRYAVVRGISIYGDSASYRIIGDQLGYLPLDSVQCPLDVGESVWVDVLFKPDTGNKSIRYASLAALLDDGQSSPTVQMIGYIGKLGVVATGAATPDVQIVPNPVSTSSFRIVCESGFLAGSTATIVDPLGRERIRRAIDGKSAIIRLDDLENGVYVVRISQGNIAQVKLLRIER